MDGRHLFNAATASSGERFVGQLGHTSFDLCLEELASEENAIPFSCRTKDVAGKVNSAACVELCRDLQITVCFMVHDAYKTRLSHAQACSGEREA